jgi:regulatory protein YycI of two-component signal transduction system YycFG
MKVMIVPIIILIIMALSIFGVWSYLNRLVNQKDDNKTEEIVEEIIEQKLDVPPGTIDLTPDSPEK